MEEANFPPPELHSGKTDEGRLYSNSPTQSPKFPSEFMKPPFVTRPKAGESSLQSQDNLTYQGDFTSNSKPRTHSGYPPPKIRTTIR
jgi:hypothetical protein